jgi:CelD/BcsL family acetyltransferase involved in cellulose biosynthesis
MIVRRLESCEGAASLRPAWNLLAESVPFRQWEWLSSWWQHYGAGKQWYVLAVHDDDGRLAGLAPWFLHQVPAFGRVVQFLGSGEACTDYLTILCRQQDRERVTSSLAQWLLSVSGSESADDWDMLHLDGLAADDATATALLQALEQGGCAVHSRNECNTWRIPLPATWDEYRRQLSKPNRRHVRTLQERLIDPGTVCVHVASTAEQLDRAWPILVDLHQRRRLELGQPGCFASPAFAGFARSAADEFLRAGQLELLWLERAGIPMAAQLGFIGGGVTYAYQVGINPTMLADSPGWLVHTESIRRAIGLGHTAFDFLRGNEPHKQRMGARSRELLTARVVPPRIRPLMLHTAWVTGDAVKHWIKTGLQITGMR